MKFETLSEDNYVGYYSFEQNSLEIFDIQVKYIMSLFEVPNYTEYLLNNESEPYTNGVSFMSGPIDKNAEQEFNELLDRIKEIYGASISDDENVFYYQLELWL